MLLRDAEIERIARDMIARHGSRAAIAAAERLNDMIDRGNLRGRDIWACVVHVIHERLGTGPAWSEAAGDHGDRDGPRPEMVCG